MINKAIIIGNLGADPEIRYTPTSKKVATFNVATTERWKDREGNQQESTEWHRIVAWEGLADICQKFLQKGTRVYIEGKIETRKWTHKDGTDRYTTEIRCREMKALANWKADEHQGGQKNDSSSRSSDHPGMEGYRFPGPGEEDVPF